MALLFSKIYININHNSQVFREKTYAGVAELVVDRKVPDGLLLKRSSEGHVIRQHYQEEYDHSQVYNKTYSSVDDLGVDKNMSDHCLPIKSGDGHISSEDYHEDYEPSEHENSQHENSQYDNTVLEETDV